jgi:hypothetical protein
VLMVVVPSALQMGWNESPAFWTSTTVGTALAIPPLGY